jgi:hypothetical protein
MREKKHKEDKYERGKEMKEWEGKRETERQRERNSRW